MKTAIRLSSKTMAAKGFSTRRGAGRKKIMIRLQSHFLWSSVWCVSALLLIAFASAAEDIAKPAVDSIRLGKPILGTVPGDVWQELSDPKSALPGQAVYAFNSHDLPFKRYLVVRNLNGSHRPTGVQNADVVTYQIEGIRAPYDLVYDPQFSPDGRYVMFKIGDPNERQGAYALFVWELETQKIKQVMGYLKHLTVLWSPDSNYFACIGGGDAEGNTEGDETLRLYMRNWRTGEKWIAAENKGVRLSFGWLAPHTLLYSILPEKQPQATDTADKMGLPMLYRFSPEEGKSQLVTKDGYRPAGSPDGKWIAFFGSENLKVPIPVTRLLEFNPQGRALSIVKPDGSGRKALNREDVTYPDIQWLPNSENLLTLKVVQPSPDAKAQIREWDISTGKVRTIGEFMAKDYRKFNRPDTDPQFQPLSVSKNGVNFFVKISEITGRESKRPRLIEVVTIKGFNLQNGAVSTVAQIKGSMGLDWFDETPPETKVPKPAATATTK
jgi:hypothetical protein